MNNEQNEQNVQALNIDELDVTGGWSRASYRQCPSCGRNVLPGEDVGGVYIWSCCNQSFCKERVYFP